MPATISTNDPRGLGYQTGLFSGDPAAPIGQDFIDAAYAGRFSDDPVYKEAYYCNVIGECKMSTWIEEYTGYETSCYPDFRLLEYTSYNQRVKISEDATVAAYPATTALKIDTASHYVSGAYVLPQVGNYIVLTPNGELAVVTQLTHATANDTTMTVRLVNQNATSQTVKANDEFFVMAGSEIDDCDCPEGQFRIDDLPVEWNISMLTLGDKGDICGDALNKCQFLKIPFTDECGNTIEKWYTEALQRMYRDHEDSKHYQRLLNPNWGIIPSIKSRGIKLTPASTDEITVDDIREWKSALNEAGITCLEYAVFAGRNLYSQFMQMLAEAGTTQLDTSLQPLSECKWLNLEWCGIRVEGMVLHIYEECTFSNGKLLGGQNMVFPNSAIFIPMCQRTTNCGGGTDNNTMITTTYFESLDGRVWDNLTDSNGVLNGKGGRNTFGAGCEQHEWTIKSRFSQTLHCLQQWMYIGL